MYLNSIIFALSAFTCYFMAIYFGAKNFSYRTNEKFSIKNVFPYETNITERFADNLAGNIFLTFGTIFSLTFYATYSYAPKNLNLVLLIAGLVGSLSIYGLYFFGLGKPKLHVACLALSIVASTVVPASLLIICINKYRLYDDAFTLIPLVLSGIIVTAALINSLNPKFVLNIKLESSENGYKRKPFYVATFSEWFMIFLFEFTKIAVITYVIR